MSDWIVIAGVQPWDGRYELDLDTQPLTTREWGWIKRHAGYLPISMTGEAFTDPEVISVLAAVALRRAGILDSPDVAGLLERLADMPFGATITLEIGDREDDAGPPPRSSDARPSTNGDSSPTGSETSETPPRPTGAPRSDTSPSDQRTSVS